MDNEKEILQQIVNESTSYSEILRKLGKSISGDSVSTLKQKLKNYEIPFTPSHKNTGNLTKQPIEHYLQKDHPCDSKSLKKRLIAEGLKKDICELCTQTNTWNGKPLTLQLDHINGDHSDNRLENLRIVCPNCHSQTDTFSTRKPVNICPDCGTEISRRSKYCRKCAPKHR